MNLKVEPSRALFYAYIFFNARKYEKLIDKKYVDMWNSIIINSNFSMTFFAFYCVIRKNAKIYKYCG